MTTSDAIKQVFSFADFGGVQVDLMTVMVAVIGLSMVVIAVGVVVHAVRKNILFMHPDGSWYHSRWSDPYDDEEFVSAKADEYEASALGDWLEEYENEGGHSKYDYVYYSKKAKFRVLTNRIGKRWAK